jgi:nucleotide-binding universal stress UspA family protein
MINSQHVFPPRRILVPSDMSDASESALRYARYFHERFGSEIRVLHAHNLELPPYFSSGQLADFKRALKRMEKAAREYVRKRSEPFLGFMPEIELVENTPAEAIFNASQAHDMDMIVMGMHGRRGLQRLWMGSVTERVIRQSSLPVLAVRSAPPEKPVGRILCPMNASEPGKQALEYAAKISKTVSAHLTVLHVVEPGDAPLTCPLVDVQTKNSCNVEEIKLDGNAAKTIAEASNNLKPDVLIMGAERKSAVLGEFFSSTTSSVMQLAVGPLLIVPKKELNNQV